MFGQFFGALAHRAFQFGVEALDALLLQVLLGDVARDRQQHHRLAVGVADRRDHGVPPFGRAFEGGTVGHEPRALTPARRGDGVHRELNAVVGPPFDPRAHAHLLEVVHLDQATALRRLGTPTALGQAISTYNEVLAKLWKDPKHQYVVSANLGAALALRELGTSTSLQKAIALLDSVCGTLTELLRPWDPDVLTDVKLHKAAALEKVGTAEAMEQAIGLCNDVVVARCEHFGPSHLGVAAAHLCRASLLKKVGTPNALSEALRSYDDVAAVLADLSGTVRQGLVAVDELDEARAQRAVGTPEALWRAVELYGEASGRRANVLGKWHTDFATSAVEQADTLQAIGTQETLRHALSLYDWAISVRTDLLGPQHPDVTAAKKNKARALQAIGT